MNAVIILLWSLSVGPAFPAPTNTTSLRGAVKETLDAGDYTYVLVSTDEGDQWAAIVKTALKKGGRVSIIEDTVMENFESRTLKRKFSRVVFGTLEPEAPTPVGKAAGSGARTIAEIYAQKSRLKGVTARTRGRVVKYNAKILGRNWLHLQDGTGSPQGKDSDLAVATEDSAAVGDVITVQGTIALDKDLGSGYVFPVLLENARIAK